TERQCAGFEDIRPRLLHPIGADLRICIVGESNAGKTTLFNHLTGSHAAVSPQVFTTRNVMARSMTIPDDRFAWLSNQFPEATLRPPKINFVDTPALLDPLESAPWEDQVYEALRQCDIFYHVIPAFNDSSVEHWRSESELEEERRRRMLPYGGEKDSEELEDDPPLRHAESARAVDDILQAYDRRLLAKLRKNETFRDDLDALTSIAENVRGYRDDDHKFNGRRVMTDGRARFHDWDERELAVLEQIQLLTAKPVVYLLNMDTEEFANASSSATFLRAQEDIQETDIDAVVLPFSGRLLQHDERAPFWDAAEPSRADAIISETLQDCEIAHFYTASKNLVAAWAVKLGTTVEEAVTLVNATLDSSVTVVEAVSMRAVVDAGSIDKARSLGLTRRLRFQDAVEDGDLLFLAPGELEGAAN
ncbi:GTP binding protein, partial [Aphelenchoides avenae]